MVQAIGRATQTLLPDDDSLLPSFIIPAFFMNKKAAFAAGFFAGIVFGVFLSTGKAPVVNAFLTLPLKWFAESLHPFPSESLANLIVAWPLWFIYWGCLGGSVALLLRAICRIFLKRRRRDGDNA